VHLSLHPIYFEEYPMSNDNSETNGSPTATEPTRILGSDFLALDALSIDLDNLIAGATGDQLSALNFRQNALKRVIGALRDAAYSSKAECPASDDSEEESLLPTHDDLEGAVNLAEDASTAEGHDGPLDHTPEYDYEEACLDRVRKTVFRMAGLVPEEKTMADTDAIEWDTLGPAAVMIHGKLIVAFPMEGTDQYPRSAELGGVLVIPISNVVPRC
jgi:hypothetical protein